MKAWLRELKYIYFTSDALPHVFFWAVLTFPRAIIYSIYYCISWFTSKCRDMMTSDFLTHLTNEQSLTPSIMSGSSGGCWNGSILHSTQDHCFQLKSLAWELRAEWLRCELAGRVLAGSVLGYSLESRCLSICQHLPRSPHLCPSPFPEWSSEAGRGVHFPSRAPNTSFQQNSSLPKRYAETNVKLIHSFSKYVLGINYEPCPSLGAGDIKSEEKDKNPCPP